MAGLVDRMVQDQVKYARQDEEIFSLRRDLSVSRQHEEDVTRQLLQTSKELNERQVRVILYQNFIEIKSLIINFHYLNFFSLIIIIFQIMVL